MSKGEDTRARVVAKAGYLMNQTGYLATPLSAILEAVDLQKGGLYNHFGSKEELALEAFRENTRALGRFFASLSLSSEDPATILSRLLNASIDVAAGRVLPGGCPVLNAGTEADDVSEPLRREAALSAEALRGYFYRPLARLEAEGRLRSGLDARSLSFLCLAAVEGGILWTRIAQNNEGQIAAVRAVEYLLRDRIV